MADPSDIGSQIASAPRSDPDPALSRYLDFWRAPNPERVAEVFSEDARFCDPFNDVRGHADIRAVLSHAGKACPQAEVTVWRAQRLDDHAALLHWRYQCKPGLAFTGLSMLRFAADGRIAEHEDFWDSGTQFYARLPGLGLLIGGIRRLLTVKPPAGPAT